jgi:tRNA U34 2-thiouridine synthase MnmA/TrmU
MAKAIGCISGGLDSTLALVLVQGLGLEVVALHVRHLWHPGPFQSDEDPGAVRMAKGRGVRVLVLDAAEADLAMVQGPEHGFGKRMNPCIDCRIWMLRRAREIMEAEGAAFVFTGEVLGQRPLSQHRGAMDLIEREAGLQDLLLRPLSAKLLPATRPEREGVVDRSRLLDIKGRSRQRQMDLARRFGIADYPTPAGGCLLTDPGFAYRLRDLLAHQPPTAGDVELLKVGRHMRLADGTRLVIGRHQEDCLRLDRLLRPGDVRIEAADMPGPTTLLRGTASPENIALAAAVTLRYAKAAPGQVRRVQVAPVGGEASEVGAEPAAETLYRDLLIAPERDR